MYCDAVSSSASTERKQFRRKYSDGFVFRSGASNAPSH
jgi:hypothetical protein